MNEIHSSASEGYKDVAKVYNTGRPGYPAEAIDFIKSEFALKEGKTLLDLGAGTGKFT